MALHRAARALDLAGGAAGRRRGRDIDTWADLRDLDDR